MVEYNSKFRTKWNGEKQMGKAKRSTGKKKKKAKQDAYLQAIVIIIISLLLAVLIYGQTGTVRKRFE